MGTYVFGFWAYTKYDPTPAKELLHFIGWDNLGNITVTNEICQSQHTVDSLSNQLIAERLTNIEQLCMRSIRLSIYDSQTPTIQEPLYPVNSPSITTTDMTMISGTTSAPRLIENSIIRQISGARL